MAFKMIYDKRNRGNIADLGDNTKVLALAWYDYLVKNGIQVLIYETIRTLATQKAYVARGASQTLDSYHIVGQALDFVLVDAKGNALWNGYGSVEGRKAIAEAKRLGFEWGGDWSSFVDKPHLQNNHRGYGTDTFGRNPVTKVNVAKHVATKPGNKPTKKPATHPVVPKKVGSIRIVGVKYAAYIVEKPSTNGKVLATISVGGKIAISGSIPGWYEVIHNGKRAYVNAAYGKLV